MQSLSFRGIPRLSAAVAAVVATAPAAFAQPRVFDGFGDPTVTDWKVVTSEAVTLEIRTEANGTGEGGAGGAGAAGQHGSCLRIDYDFTRGSGYGIIRRDFDPPIALAANYRFAYAIRGEGPRNTVEFKLIDESGDNVWWVNQTNFEFPKDWRTITLPKRKITFAWGPSGPGVPLASVKTIEFAITSYNGGKGTVWLDELTLEELPTPSGAERAVTSTKRSSNAHGDQAPSDASWTSFPPTEDAAPTITYEFANLSEFGGVKLDWSRGPRDFDVLVSFDGHTFTLARSVRGFIGGASTLQFPDGIAKAVRIACVPGGVPAQGVELSRVEFLPPEFGDHANNLLREVAKSAPRGRYPRQFLDQAAYWTIAGGAGVNGDENEVLVSEDGAIELKKSGFSLEPVIVERSASNSTLRTWSDGESAQSLIGGFVPAPIVERRLDGLTLDIRAVVDGSPGASVALVRYTLTNTSNRPSAGVLNILIRPYQVNPVYQWLNTHGGVGNINRLAFENGSASVDGTLVTPLRNPTAFGATRFDSGEVIEHIARGSIPKDPAVDDPSGLASGVLAFRYALKPGESLVVPIAAGLNKQACGIAVGDEAAALAAFNQRFDAAVAGWKARLNTVEISLPRSAQRLADTVKANLAYILINRDGSAVHPGSRSYERAWIRDGSLTSAALLSFGFEKEATEFADWFGPYQYDNGKVPCCVDRRGPDPVPEHDSHGQYIWLVLNIFRHAGDSAFLARHYPRVLKAVEYIEFLRAQRMTPEYASAEGLKKGMYGILPESISHEGYSAKPMHSYWDQFFAARGLADAARIAELMGDAPNAARLSTLRDDFNAAVVASLAVAMREKNIDYLPGCVELGDFDATSTTVALWPCALRGTLPEAALQRTFDKYFEFFQDRAQGRKDWKDYTPYEHRTVGSMIILGKRERAHEIWDWFFMHQRPAGPAGREGGWRHWAEVVWKDERTPKFIGDMPHTWVGSDFINSFRALFMYERGDGAVILGAGLPHEWAHERVHIKGLRTPGGSLELSMRGDSNHITINVAPGLAVPAGGLFLAPPSADRIQGVRVNGEVDVATENGLIRLPRTPAIVEIQYRGLPR